MSRKMANFDIFLVISARQRYFSGKALHDEHTKLSELPKRFDLTYIFEKVLGGAIPLQRSDLPTNPEEL